MVRNIQVTLAVSGNVYDLMTLIQANAEIAAEEVLLAYFPLQVAQVIIQAAVGTVTLVDRASDSNLGPTLATGASMSIGPFGQNIIDLSAIKLKGGTTSTTASITIVSV